MVGLILTIIYLLGIPLTFYAIGGMEDFKPDEVDEDDDPLTASSRYSRNDDRYLAIAISACISFMWPLFWAVCIGTWLMGRIFGGLS